MWKEGVALLLVFKCCSAAEYCAQGDATVGAKTFCYSSGLRRQAVGINYCANNLGNNYYPAMFEGKEEFEAFQAASESYGSFGDVFPVWANIDGSHSTTCVDGGCDGRLSCVWCTDGYCEGDIPCDDILYRALMVCQCIWDGYVPPHPPPPASCPEFWSAWSGSHTEVTSGALERGSQDPI